MRKTKRKLEAGCLGRAPRTVVQELEGIKFTSSGLFWDDGYARETLAWLRAENPFAVFVRTIDSFRPASMPPMARHSYRQEILAGMFLPWLVGLTEGGVIGVIVKKYFDGVVEGTALNFAVATLTAAPAFANITSFLWARLTHGRHKIRSVNLLQIGVAVLVAAIALAPRSPGGLAMVLACAVCARICLAGVVTLRAVVWRNNYAKPVRAHLTSRIVTVVTIVLASVGAIVGFVMDRDPSLFRVMMPAGALEIPLIGMSALNRLRTVDIRSGTMRLIQ